MSGDVRAGRQNSPVLTFLTSVRHPANSSDYREVERLLLQTLRSLGSQHDQRCEVVVVANRPVPVPPDTRLSIRVVVVDFPPPSPHNGPMTGIEAVLLDKGTKLAVALSHVDAGHVMFVDADDFVSADLTSFVAAHTGDPGWYVEAGLVYDERRGLIHRTSRFNELCGTSLVVRRDLLPAVHLEDEATQEDVLQAYGSCVILEDIGSHRHLARRLALPPLPFAGAAYAVATGENHSGKTMRRLGRPVSRSVAEQFGLPRRSPVTACAHFGFAVVTAGIRRARSLLRRTALLVRASNGAHERRSHGST